LLVPTEHTHKDFLVGCVLDALTRLVLPSLEREARRDLTEKSELHAVEVFARNLRNLLLQPPLLRKRVLAIDPGFKNGCKLAAIDEFGALLEHALVHIVGSDEQKAAGRTKLVELIRHHQLTVVAIGNGTACRQSEQLIAEILANELAGEDVHYIVVNEAGASVYSTSEIGREEFPECDAMQRSAISIGRRLQDPLSELVKIDPASIGVGLYQHDTRAKHLRDTLDGVVQSCVSFVGVELNSASSALLRYVSGMNQLTARRVYEYRQQHGPFRSREQLLEVSGFGDATFVQAAGFLKIDKGSNPLDATWIHPENYSAAERLLGKLGIDAIQLSDSATASRIRQAVAVLERDSLPGELGIGQLALDDMIESLSKPGRDPRSDLPPPIFRKDVVNFDDLAVGMELRGTVLNVVDFGAFVDVGLSDSGLVHVSQLSTDYVRNPLDVVAAGDQVRVWVASIDKERRRVALSMIEPGTEKERPTQQRKPRGKRPPQNSEVVENAEQAPRRHSRPARQREQQGERTSRPKRGRDRDRDRRPPPRTGAFERRATKSIVPITKKMEEGKEAMRTFGDLLQFHRKKSQSEQPTQPTESEQQVASDSDQAAVDADNNLSNGAT
jgi:uncharacterized protein